MNPEAGKFEPTPELNTLDGLALTHIFGSGAAWLEQHVLYVNSLNVFPVPDGDTGTNMLHTVHSAVQAAYATPSRAAGAVCGALAQGALLGARGNSGVILSQILRGFARRVEQRQEIDAHLFGEALVEGSCTAYNGMVNPVEGTILTVIREAADRARLAATHSDALPFVLSQTVLAARDAVARTEQLLPVLKQAGVVDAGGAGLLLILEGASKYLNGETVSGEPQDSAALTAAPLHLERLARAEGWGYDIQFHIRGRNLDLPLIRDRIAAMGESAIIVGDDTLIKVHVHAPNPGDILKFGAEQGALVNIAIENMQEQYVDFMAGGTADRRVGAENQGGLAGAALARQEAISPDERRVGEIATIAVAPGPGLRRVFESLRVSSVVAGGPTMNPSTRDLLTAVKGAEADTVILLPNDKNIIAAASQVQQLTDKRLHIVPSRSAPQGLAALLAFNFQADLETNLRLMNAALHRVRTIEVTHATRSIELNGLGARQGEPIALLDGELIAASEDMDALTLHALRAAAAQEAEIITLYYGSQVSAEHARRLGDRLAREFAGQVVEVHEGGQPLYPYIISVE